MNLKNNVLIWSKSVFKWTLRKRWCSSTASPLNMPNIEENLRSLKRLKYPESMFVHNNDVASKYKHTIIIYILITKCNCIIVLNNVKYGSLLVNENPYFFNFVKSLFQFMLFMSRRYI